MIDEENGKSYSQNDHLASIGFQAQPGDIYYMNPPKELSSYQMYIDNPQKKRENGRFLYFLHNGWYRYNRAIKSPI